jgi:hypothetical protein
MKMQKILAVMALATLFLFMNACSFNVSTASVSNVLMCDKPVDEVCTSDMTEFTTSSPMFYLSCDLNYAPEDTKIKFSWFKADGERFLIDSVSLRSGDIGSGSTFNVHSNLSRPNNGWPLGNYEVEVSLNTDNFKPIVKAFVVK